MSTPFALTILGISSAIPTRNRQPTAQILNVNDQLFLIDCGEATQIQLRRLKIRYNKINHIFISHLHGDHYLGLLGLISSMHLEGRTGPLYIYCPKGLDEIINIQLKYSQTKLNFPIHFSETIDSVSYKIFENEEIDVYTIPLKHRIPCCGYLFREKLKVRKILKEKIIKYNIPKEILSNIKKGSSFETIDGLVIPNHELTTSPPIPRSFAYCSDTAYFEEVIPTIYESDMLYHEATFMQEHIQRAHETWHSTTLEAATIALKANVKQLIIGHFSARYNDLLPLVEEAKTIFENSILAMEGVTYPINRTEKIKQVEQHT